MLQKSLKNLLLLLPVAFACLFAVACSESNSSAEPEETDYSPLFKNCDAELDEDHFVIELSKSKDSLKVLSLESLGGSKYYLAQDDDPVDPEIDWGHPLKSGSVIVVGEKGFANIVALDKNNRVVAVWQIQEPKDSSSSSKKKSSSSSAKAESSSSFEKDDSSSSADESAESSSVESEEQSSSSENIESSGEQEVLSSSAEGPQLPGCDFSKRDDSFWATTSDAMATEGTGSYYIWPITYTVTMHSQANGVFEDSKLTLTSTAVAGKSVGIDGGWKLAGGFYFAGTFSGKDAASIYMADNEDAGADDNPADFSKYMKHGRPFTARPVSFTVSYSYDHQKGDNESYPQQSLIYVMLVSEDQKVVAAGALVDSISIDSLSAKTVDLVYGSDAGLIKAGYAGTEKLKVGTGEEEVAEIRVMFASSAWAFVADGGTSSQKNKKFRGGENSKLVIDDFKLNY